jgi:hypothetical protein
MGGTTMEIVFLEICREIGRLLYPVFGPLRWARGLIRETFDI